MTWGLFDINIGYSKKSIADVIEVVAPSSVPCKSGGDWEAGACHWALGHPCDDYDLFLEFGNKPKRVPSFNLEKPGTWLNAIWILHSALIYVVKLDIFVILIFR